MEGDFTFNRLNDDVSEIYPDNTLFAYDGKGNYVVKNEQDVQLLERLAFMARREGNTSS